jgi:uncharacterized membrane protein YeaQ/YmgE (transglycosylase-associated protein family)
MPFILVALLVVVSLMIFFTVAGTLVHFVLFLFMAGVVGWLADLIVPGKLPYGWLGAILAGLVGGWLGTMILGPMGPSLFGVRFIPTLVGAIILALGVELVGKLMLRQRALRG